MSINLSKIKLGPQESSVDLVKRFHHEAVEEWSFKFSLAKQKETTLAEALRKATDFIRATKICAESTDVPEKAKIPGDRNPRHKTGEVGGDERP